MSKSIKKLIKKDELKELKELSDKLGKKSDEEVKSENEESTPAFEPKNKFDLVNHLYCSTMLSVCWINLINLK
jgi:hypothetical protein